MAEEITLDDLKIVSVKDAAGALCFNSETKRNFLTAWAARGSHTFRSSENTCADCAKAALRFERPALEAVDSTINERSKYIMRVSQPSENMADWEKQLSKQKDQNADSQWAEHIEQIADESKSGQPQRADKDEFQGAKE